MTQDLRNPGDDYIRREIDEDRRHERTLIPKALLALVVVAVLVVVRQVFFA
jgi:hypothetical protein